MYSPEFYDASAVISLAADISYPYPRHFGVIGDDLYISFARERQLVLAGYQQCFAGDATYKTARQSGRQEKSEWYLINILTKVQFGDVDLSRSAVVYRAIATALTSNVCCWVWEKNFKDIMQVTGKNGRTLHTLSKILRWS